MTGLVELDLGRNNIKQIFDNHEMSKLLLQHGKLKNKQPLQCFENLKIHDLSANKLTILPTELDCLHLEDLNLMNNLIETIPVSFFTTSNLRTHLRRLLLNQNPLRELDFKIKELGKLEVLGIAMTQITKLPSSIASIKSLREIYVKDTPLKTPKLALAMRGINAIREFFNQNEDDADEEIEETGKTKQSPEE